MITTANIVEFVSLFLFFYLWHAMGITIGYHRLLSHRTFNCSKAVEYFWVLGGFLAFEGSPIWWATIHRAHHKYSDTALDPHSPRYGLFRSLFGWLLEKEYASHINPSLQSKDLLKDPIYRFLECGGNLSAGHALSFAINFAVRGLIWYFYGWLPALASLLAGYAVLQIPLMLNVACHMTSWGYKNFKTSDDSVNVWWVAILACGEGWHNNHHALPGSAKSGLRPHEFDLSWQMISLMQKFGLAKNVNVLTHRSYDLREAKVSLQNQEIKSDKSKEFATLARKK